MALMYLFI